MPEIETTPNPDRQMIDNLTVKPTPSAGGINLDTPVQAGGKAYTVKDLLDRAAEADRLGTEVKSGAALKGAVKTAFLDDSADEETRRSAMRTLLGGGGADDATIDAILDAMGGDPDPEPEPARSPRGGPNASPNQSEEELKTLRSLVERDREERLTNFLNGQARRGLTSEESKVGKRLSAMQKAGLLPEGDDYKTILGKFEKQVSQDARSAARAALSRKRAGEALSEGEVQQAVDAALDRLYDTIAVIPEAALVGRTGETVDPFSDLGLPEKPLEFPDPAKSVPGQHKNRLRAFGLSKLAEAVRAAGSTNSSA